MDKMYLATTPALQPPPGVESNLLDPDSLNPVIIGVSTLCLVLATIMISIRLVTKLLTTRKFLLEDFLSASAWIGFVGFTGVFYAMGRAGAGRHQWDVSLLNYMKVNRLVNAADIGYCVVILLSKLPILLQYIRIFMPARQGLIYWAAQTLIWTNLLFYIASSFAFIFECTPREKIWDTTAAGKCIDLKALFLVTGSWNIVSDFSILILPIVPIWKLQMSPRKKLGIYAVFSTGVFACITSVIRLVSNVQYEKTTDLNYKIVPQALWSLAEITTVILCGSLPMLPNFLKLLRKNRRSSMHEVYLKQTPSPAPRLPRPRPHPLSGISLLNEEYLPLDDHVLQQPAPTHDKGSCRITRAVSGLSRRDGHSNNDHLSQEAEISEPGILKTQTVQIQTLREEDGRDIELGFTQPAVFH
ncbi:MAG: hypothetical protein L6R36_006888 [Xanthoria steineri]|nr:MAG: hypothetical protein L6R36_006888 [Xanthoria steineri]